MTRARTVAEVIAGEAVSGTPEERMADMRAIASVIANRAALLGVTQQEVVANQNEFNIYGQTMPAGTENLVDMAQEAIDHVATNGPTTSATFYATPEAAPNLPGGLDFESETTGHQYFTDPQNRAIYTQNGLTSPNAFAYAANPANVPVPDLQGGFLNSWSEMAAAPPMQAMQREPGAWGLNWDVAPALTPAVNSWSDVAAAKPVAAPMDSVTAQGFLGAPPDLAASATARPMMDLPASAEIAGVPGFDASASAAGSIDPATVSSRMGLAEPDMDQSRFSGLGLSVAPVDASRFASTAKTSRIGQDPAFDMARMPGLVDPGTNVVGFLDVPQAPADLGNFPDAVTAQRGPPTGIYSAEMQAMQGHTYNEALKAEAARQAALNQTPSVKTAYADEPAVAPAVQAIEQQTAVNVPASGFLGTNPALSAQAAVPSLPGTMSPQQIAGYQQAAKSFAKAGMLNIGQQPPTTLSGELPTNLDVLGTTTAAAPDLETVEVADQPAVSNTQVSIPGPATTDVADQQQITAPAKATRTTPAAVSAQPSFSDRISKALNPGTTIGAAIGAGLLGVPGAVAGGFLGNTVNGFLNAPSQPMSINNIGSSYDAVTSIWGGGQPVGTQATASDGQTVTSMPGGMTALTNTHGVTTMFDKSGKAMSYFGDGLSQDQDAETEGRESGGLFGGLFG